MTTTNRSIVKKLSGRCLCQAISWTLEDVLVGQVLVCHCSMCRQISGATSVPFAAVPKAGLLQEQLLRQDVKIYQSSGIAKRYFCPTCGSFVCMEYLHEAATVWIPMGSLDQESALLIAEESQQQQQQRQSTLVIDPDRDSHIMVEGGAPFAQALDQLPRAPGFGPYRSDPCCGRPWQTLKTLDELEKKNKDDSGASL